MGGGNKAQNTQSTISADQLNISNQQNQLAQQNQAEGMSLMQPLIEQLQSLSSGNPQSVQTALAPFLTNITQNNSQQKGQTMESMGPGVGRDVALESVTQQSGNQIAGQKNALIQNAPQELAKLGSSIESFGLSDVGAALSGASGASTSNQAVMQSQAASKQATMGFLGSLAGAAAKPFAFGCWIAEAIYGVDDMRTHIVRAWLNDVYSHTFIGGVVMWLYRRFGRGAARMVERSAFLRWILKPLFDRALAHALNDQVTVESILYAR
jgi:hypothetical protein